MIVIFIQLKEHYIYMKFECAREIAPSVHALAEDTSSIPSSHMVISGSL